MEHSLRVGRRGNRWRESIRSNSIHSLQFCHGLASHNPKTFADANYLKKPGSVYLSKRKSHSHFLPASQGWGCQLERLGGIIKQHQVKIREWIYLELSERSSDSVDWSEESKRKRAKHHFDWVICGWTVWTCGSGTVLPLIFYIAYSGCARNI